MVQSAEAERDAVKAAADGQAYKIEVTATAEAKKVRISAAAEAERKVVIAEAESFRILTEYTGRAEGVALLDAQLTPIYNDYLRAQGWDGVLPRMMLGSDSNILFSVPAVK